MNNHFYYRCLTTVVLQLLIKSEFSTGIRRSCKTRDCKHSNSKTPISSIRAHHLVLLDNPVQYDDENVHFRHVHKSRQRNRPSALLKSHSSMRHVPDIRARNKKRQQLSGRVEQFPNGTFYFPEVVEAFKDCPWKCHVPEYTVEPQCGKNGMDYVNTCLRECAGIELLVMGKCPQCNCKNIFEQECVAAGSANTVCVTFCKNEQSKFHVDCTGNKLTNGPCICSKETDYKGCGSNGVSYGNICIRECAGVPEIHPRHCIPCSCFLLWETSECGYELAFEKNFSMGCIKKCEEERIRLERRNLLICHVGKKHMCQCPLESGEVPVCGYDYIEYTNGCALKCAMGEGIKPLSHEYCPRCNCLASIWSKECGATDFLPIDPSCHDNCSKEKLLLAKKKMKIVCNTKTSRKACVCPSRSKKECGTDGETYENECERRCKDGGNFAYVGDCVTR